MDVQKRMQLGMSVIKTAKKIELVCCILRESNWQNMNTTVFVDDWELVTHPGARRWQRRILPLNQEC